MSTTDHLVRISLSLLEDSLRLTSITTTVNYLYFGCRSATQDEHYASEWIDLVALQQLTYRVAHSRDGKEGEPRVYVQDQILEDAKQVWRLLKDGAWVYISGCVCFVMDYLG